MGLSLLDCWHSSWMYLFGVLLYGWIRLLINQLVFCLNSMCHLKLITNIAVNLITVFSGGFISD